MKAHSKIGASAMYRWEPCPGSVRMEADQIDTPSSYAEEGSAAHFLSESCVSFSSGKPYFQKAAAYLGKYIARNNKGKWDIFPPELAPADAFEVTEQMVDAVQLYLDTIQAEMEDGAELRIEHRFCLDNLHPDLFGTCDAVIVVPFGPVKVIDLKYGAGVPVEV